MHMDMELTKQDTQLAKGAAVLGMVMLHLFCRLGELPYTPWIWIGEVPLIYYLGLFGDLCVPVFCFCSGYAHYLMWDAQGPNYPGRLPGKAVRFLCNYWIVVILFSIIGLFFDRSGQIPGTWMELAGNLLLMSNSYNGSWWFAATYLFLLVLSPVLAALTKKRGGVLLMTASLCIYFVAHVLRYRFVFELPNPALQWIWNQLVLLGASLFPYLVGMVCRKYGLIGSLRAWLADRPILRRMVVFGIPTAAFLGHCIVPSSFVAPFTAIAVLIGAFLARLPQWAEKLFLLLGRHSTNIWLVHMFFTVRSSGILYSVPNTRS